MGGREKSIYFLDRGGSLTTDLSPAVITGEKRGISGKNLRQGQGGSEALEWEFARKEERGGDLAVTNQKSILHCDF